VSHGPSTATALVCVPTNQIYFFTFLPLASFSPLLLHFKTGVLKYLLSSLIGWLLVPAMLWAQVGDSLPTPTPDSLATAAPPLSKYQAAIKAISDSSLYLNAKGSPEALLARPKLATNNKNYLFYLLTGVVLFLALLRFIYARYFATLFTVFFNTSLRQGQLTDQLLQAKLPSLLYNCFFIISGGVFIYLLLQQFGYLPTGNKWWLGMPLCIAILGLIYGCKYLVLRFTGWLTSYREALNTYTFIIFLINKIIGIILVPVIVVMALAAAPLAQNAAIVALMATGLMLLLRFFKSYGLLQGQIKVGRLHFLLYIIGVEMLPLLLIYKGLVNYLIKK
jgi:Domain of unknown function (DUF4271)